MKTGMKSIFLKLKKAYYEPVQKNISSTTFHLFDAVNYGKFFFVIIVIFIIYQFVDLIKKV